MAKSKQDSWDFKGQEIEVEELTVLSDGTRLQATLKGHVESTLDNDTIGTTAEDGYLHLEKADGTVIKVPYWLDD